MKANFDPKNLLRAQGPIIGGIALLWLGSNAIYRVNAGEKAVKFNILTGLGKEHFIEGLHLKIHKGGVI